MTETVGPPRRVRFETSDPAEAREFLDRMYGADVRVSAPRGTTWQMVFSLADAGEFSCADVKLPAALRFTLHGEDKITISTAVEGTTEIERGQLTGRYRAGDVFIGNQPRTDSAGTSRNCRVHVVTLPASLLAETAGRPGDGPAARWELRAGEPVAGGAPLWRSATRFVDDLLASPEAAASPLLIGSARRLLVATALTIFPNTAVAPATTGDSRDAHPVTVRRAVTFIHEHASEDIALTDIAAAARVTARAVQLAFRRHLDTTPTEYLRRIRLEFAHRELQAADPAEETVTGVAYRWGFASPSRFTAHYRDTYGIRPSQTLRGD
jgi:AraC-like DNA-binding protein